MAKVERNLAERNLSSLLYRFRGYILGVIAVALFAFPPSLFPETFCINDCIAGILVAVPLYVASAFLRVRTRQFIGEHTRGSELVCCGVVTELVAGCVKFADGCTELAADGAELALS